MVWAKVEAGKIIVTFVPGRRANVEEFHIRTLQMDESAVPIYSFGSFCKLEELLKVCVSRSGCSLD